MKIEEFLSRLEGVQQGSDSTRWVAKCPAHPDDQASLGIHVTPQGKILLKCYAGCSTSDIVAAMGLKMSDLFADDWKGKTKYKVKGSWQVFPADTPVEEIVAEFTKSNGKRKPTAKAPPAVTPETIVKPLSAYRKKRPSKHICYYEYEDENGAKIFRVDRRVYTDEKGGKTFVQQHPNEKGGWDYGVSRAGVTRVPFRLPRILEAAKAGKNVIIVEGEKDVLNVEKLLGVCATCNPGGAGKWEAGWGRFFKGVPKILIVADNDALTKIDEKTGEAKIHAVGQRHANKVERLLRADGFEGVIKKIVLPAVEDEKVKDFSDWVEARVRRGLEVGKSAFQEMIKSAAEWPSDWDWSEDADLSDLQRSQNSERNSAFSSASPEMPGDKVEEDWKKSADGVGEGVGRFGRPAPRAPFKDERVYEVDFRTSSDRIVRLAVSTKRYLFRGFIKRSDGGWSLTTSYDDLELKLPAMVPMTVGCMSRFDSGKQSNRQSSEVQAAIVLLWLRSRGKFFWDENAKGFSTSLYFDEATGVLMRVRSDEFAAFIATAAEVNRESSGFKYLMSLIDDAALNPDVSRGVVPSNMWDRRGDKVYISNGDDRMYRLADGKVEDIQNGSDGVVFMRGKTLAPWKLQSDAGKDPFDNAIIFTNASWADKTGRMNVRLWILNLFACHQTKPIMLITGGAGSGKTRMAKAIKEILGVRTDGRLDLSVQQVEDGDKGLDAFWATVNDGKLEVFDNLDTKIKWVSDTLQNVATDGQTKRRTLYTTFGVSILRANAHLILTSNNPIFSTEGNGGMADRLISAHLDLNRSASMDTELSEDIRVNRDAFMTWIAKTVALALADPKEVDQSINRRHPDYGRFSVKCGRALGRETEVIEALGAAEVDKSLLPLRNDVVTKEILEVLQANNWSMRFTGGEMSDAIIKRKEADDGDEKTRQMFGSRRVGKAMSKYIRQFSAVFKVMEPRTVEGRTVYEFTGLTPAGALAMGEAVGSVGLKGDFAKSTRILGGADGFSQNAPINAPNPPYARALGGVSPSKEEEVNKGDIEDDDDLEF